MSNVKKRVQSYRIKDLNSNDYVIDQSLTRQHDLRMTHKNAGRMNPSQLIRVANHNECSQIALTIKFENMAEQWFEEYAELNHRDTTLQRERNLCKRTYLAIGHMFLDEITTRDIQLFINDLAKYGVNMDNGKPLSYKTVRHHLSFVSDVFEYAIRMDIINYNPCLKVIVPKNIQNRSPKDNEKRIYTKDQARKFLELLSEAPAMYRVYFTLCMFTGCRRAELLGLEWKDFNYEKQTVHIVRTSNYSKRYIVRGGMNMFIEIFNGMSVFSRLYINYDNEVIDIAVQPNRDIKNISDIFTYPDKGFVFDFNTISIFLKNRGITADSKEGVYTNIDDNIKVVVLK